MSIRNDLCAIYTDQQYIPAVGVSTSAEQRQAEEEWDPLTRYIPLDYLRFITNALSVSFPHQADHS